MKHVLINSGLVVALLGFFVVPMFGFSFLKYSQPKDVVIERPTVLGDKDVRSRNSFDSEINIIDQIDVNLHLGKDTSQVFYNIVPKEYVGLKYKFIVVFPNEFKEKGLELSVVEASTTINLKAFVSPDFKSSGVIPLTVLVVE